MAKKINKYNVSDTGVIVVKVEVERSHEVYATSEEEAKEVFQLSTYDWSPQDFGVNEWDEVALLPGEVERTYGPVRQDVEVEFLHEVNDDKERKAAMDEINKSKKRRHA